MAIDIDNLQIEIEASASDASKAISSLTRRLNNLGKAINTLDDKKLKKVSKSFKQIGASGNIAARSIEKTSVSAKKAQKSFDGLASAFGKFYATYFLFIRGAKGIWRNIESSMDYVETSNYFSVALGQIGQQFEEAGYETAELYTEALSSELNKLNEKLTGYTVGSKGEALFSGDVGLGMDIEQMMNFQAKTLAVTNSVGLMGDASLQTAKAVSMLTGDLSSLTNTDLESVMTNLSSGLIGQSRALYKYGIDITQNTLQQYALAEGIEKSVSEMTQAEKMQLRLLAILDQSSVAHSDLANTINSVANQYRVADQQIGNLGRTIGNLFLPVVKNVLPYVNGLIIALNNLFTSLGFELYGDTWLEDLQSGISGGVQEGFEDIEDSADDATDALNEFKKGVRGFDELNVLTGGTSVGSGILGELEGQIDLTESITKAVADYENSWNDAFATAENKASAFAEKLTAMFEKTGAVENFKDIADSIEKFGDAISPFAEGFGDGFLGFFGELAKTSFDAFNKSLEIFSGVLDAVPEETLKSFGEVFGVLVGTLVTFNTLNSIQKKFTSLSDGLGTLGATLKAHPLLASFAVAEGLLYLINLPAEKAKIKIDVEMSDIITDIEELEISVSETSELLNATKEKMESLDEVKLETVYKKWSKLNSKVGELTDEEKGLLKAYADIIKDEFPEAQKYIDANGFAYEGMVDNLEIAIQKAIELAKVQGIDSVISEFTELQLKAEIDVEKAKKTLDEIVDTFKEKLPELSKDEIRDFLTVYSLERNILGKPGPESMRPLLDIAKERNPERTTFANVLVGDLADIPELAELQQIADKYKAAYQPYLDSQTKLIEVEEELGIALEYSVEIRKHYEEFLKDLEETNSEIFKSTVEDFNKKFGLSAESAEELKTSFDDLLKSTKNWKSGFEEIYDSMKESFDELSKNISSIDRTGINTEKILTPNFTMRARGGLVSSGQVFVARENQMPEMVGRFGNQTAVANNDQIVSGIQAGVYSAMVSALSTMNTGGGETVIMIDGREVFRAVKSAESENFRKTGNSVFVH